MLEIFSSKKRVWRAVRKGTVMAFANASIIMLIATIADVLQSVWTIVAIMVASLLAYFAAYQEARFDDEQDAWEAQQKAQEAAEGSCSGEETDAKTIESATSEDTTGGQTRAEAADTSSTELEKGQ
ncbi:Uncharacterised protein [Rothia aeria]|uniref:Uncharacterized protein n=1 Tax=Rothia aeria TaxID=172042 RepID=A0A7Z9D6E6_9MICC|nr:hypothetical protein [Rothia aeria]VEI22835.1 Uncharacterised protein [Rothia aeria]